MRTHFRIPAAVAIGVLTALLSLQASRAAAQSASRLTLADPLALAPVTLNAMTTLGEAPITLETVGWHPRGGHPPVSSPHYSSGPVGYGSSTQIHGGIFEPSHGNGQGFTMGLRGGPNLAPNLQLGIAADWEHRGNDFGNVVGSSPGPGGTVVVTRQISNSSENTFPLMMYLQLQANPKRVLVPYAGIAGGYEIVTLNATDYATGSTFNATYGGWGWQSWAGMRVALAPRTGLLAEVYTNQATAYRDVYDAFYGATLRESVGLDGVGFRAGLSWGMY